MQHVKSLVALHLEFGTRTSEAHQRVQKPSKNVTAKPRSDQLVATPGASDGGTICLDYDKILRSCLIQSEIPRSISLRMLHM